MNFTLEGRILKYIDENHIFIKLKNNDWKEISMYNDLDGYKRLSINRKPRGLHRVLAYLFLGLEFENKEQHIDHINGIRDDNRLENLRIVSQQQNKWNLKNIKGYRLKGNKYEAKIGVNNKQIHLGYYNTEEEARQAYLDAKSIYHVLP